MINRCLFLALLFLLTGQAIAQTKTVSRSNQQWMQYYNHLQFSEKWSVHTDGGWRWREGFAESSQHIVRTGLGYKTSQNSRLVVGAAQSSSYAGGERTRMEFRVYQELTVSDKISKVGFNHRFRVEQRFFSEPTAFNWRFRYGFSFGIPIYRPSTGVGAVTLNLGDEIFINAGSEIVNNVFNQNRILISPSVEVAPGLKAALTWSNQFSGTQTAGTYRHTHVLWLQIKHKIDLTEY